MKETPLKDSLIKAQSEKITILETQSIKQDTLIQHYEKTAALYKEKIEIIKAIEKEKEEAYKLDIKNEKRKNKRLKRIVRVYTVVLVVIIVVNLF